MKLRVCHRTYVCTACRVARRAEGSWPSELRCASCREPLWNLGSKWRIPAKTNDKGWRELAEKVAVDRVTHAEQMRQRGTDILRWLDIKIRKLEEQNRRGRHAKQLGELYKRRMKVVADHFPDQG
ncbi:hypothetical protein [Luteolibacter sp. Populi]|uniref:hypothetical protein n=1 Tax=Luteolibacter sp. Populi TaxID=3230487 RepID=UPI0034670643